ncbi:MAG: PEP-CTERM sorting domain-containing protein [Verrucomicrobiales bacterium]|nr:PEP-CTERM sorting domain-containing protein [Verrucomicrobiales bacterium]
MSDSTLLSKLCPCFAGVLTALSLIQPLTAATYSIAEQTALIAPSTRGGPNTTYYGWDTFNDADARNVPINDNTPDMGTAPVGALFRTTNGEDHVLGSGNFYLFAGNPAEEVTAVASGILGTGFTTVILQGLASFDPFPGPWVFAPVNGVAPQVVQGVNAGNFGQFWVRYDLPGNDASYVIPFGATGQHFSLDKFTVDTFWSPTGFQPDLVIVPEPSGALVLALSLGAVVLGRRRQP